ncbi:MAG: hypothetical protein RL757_515 [Bacteroidota bacterium]|jgi:uncharacterized membrane protein YfcA
MVEYLLIGVVAFGASMLTFFSGFGLGTLLLPAFAMFFPIEIAVAMTAIVHFLNNIFKIGLVGFRFSRRVLLVFGIPSLLGALLGAFCLQKMGQIAPIFAYECFGKTMEISVLKICIGVLLLFFALFEILPALKNKTFNEKYLPYGGALSGFFGGLVGFQGALRSAFLIRLNLPKIEFIATGIAIACLVDVSRLSLYSTYFFNTNLDFSLIGVATLCAFAGAWGGNRFLKKITVETIQKIVALLLIVFGVLSILGIV